MDTYIILNHSEGLVDKIEAVDYVHENGYFIFFGEGQTKIFAVHEKYVYAIKVESK